MKQGMVASLLGLGGLLAGYWLWTPDKDRATLEARYSNPATDFVEAAGLRLHVRDSGPKDAPAVILLHGFGGSLHTWERWSPVLSRDHRVIRLDLPGAGLTGADPSGDYTDARSLRVLSALMDRLGIRHASVIGHSMGGRIAWRFAAENPARVDKLVLISPDGFASPGFEYGKKPQVPWAVKLMRYVLPRPVLRMSLAPAYADPAVMTEELVTRYYDMILAPGVRASMISRMEQSVLQDPVPMLGRIEAATLVLWGEKDAMIPVRNAADYVRALPKATLVTLPGVGHLPQEEAPDASLQAVNAFLKN